MNQSLKNVLNKSWTKFETLKIFIFLITKIDSFAIWYALRISKCLLPSPHTIGENWLVWKGAFYVSVPQGMVTHRVNSKLGVQLAMVVSYILKGTFGIEC